MFHFIKRRIKKPATAYFAFVLAFAIEMHGIPMLLMWPFILVLYYRLAKKEEKDMIDEFGEEYIMYMEKTKMFIPFLI